MSGTAVPCRCTSVESEQYGTVECSDGDSALSPGGGQVASPSRSLGGGQSSSRLQSHSLAHASGVSADSQVLSPSRSKLTFSTFYTSAVLRYCISRRRVSHKRTPALVVHAATATPAATGTATPRRVGQQVHGRSVRHGAGDATLRFVPRVGHVGTHAVRPATLQCTTRCAKWLMSSLLYCTTVVRS